MTKIEKVKNIILKTLIANGGEANKTVITYAIRNHKKDDKAEAIHQLFEAEIILSRDEVSKTGKGRKPVVIYLTREGKKIARKIEKQSSKSSIWGGK